MSCDDGADEASHVTMQYNTSLCSLSLFYDLYYSSVYTVCIYKHVAPPPEHLRLLNQGNIHV